MYKINPVKKKIRPFYFLILFTVICLFFLSGTVKIREVSCFTQFGVCKSDFSSALSWTKGYPILRPLPVTKIKHSLSKYSDIKKISVYRRLPSTIVIGITLRSPIGLVGSSVLGSYAVADDTGFVYGVVTQDNYPVLILPKIPQVNSYLDSPSVSALKSLALLGNLTDKKISGRVEGDSLYATISGETETIIGLHVSPDQWYTPLQLILNRSKMRGKMPRKIDLRFENSIISY